jgi:hypothetical protein
MMLIMMKVALVENENLGAVLVGIERTTRLLLRCKAYERYYIVPDPKSFNWTSLEKTLVELYVSVLEFLVSVKRFLDQSHLGMLLTSSRGH